MSFVDYSIAFKLEVTIVERMVSKDNEYPKAKQKSSEMLEICLSDSNKCHKKVLKCSKFV